METNTAQSSENSTNGHSPAPTEALKQAAARFSEAREYATHFVAAKIDAAKLTVRSIVVYAVLGIVGAIIGVGMLLTAAALLFIGLAGAIGAIFEPDKPWVGALIVGFLVIASTVIGVIVVMKKLTGASRKATIEKYEARKRAQRNQFGHDVQERAREQVQREECKQHTAG